MKFKLPSLHQVVNSKGKTAEDIKQYIYIHNGIAMTFGDPVFIVDLYDYVKTECNIEDDDDLSELESIITHLNNRSIPATAWKELTTECDVTLEDNEIVISKVSHKMILDLEYNSIGLPYFKKTISRYVKILESPTLARDTSAFKGSIIQLMGSVFKKETKSNTIRLFSCDNSAAVKFTVNGKPYIMGIFNIDEDVNQLNKDLTAQMDIDDMIGKMIEDLNYNGDDLVPNKAQEIKDVPSPFSIDPEENIFNEE